jgi:hypothetical protein
MRQRDEARLAGLLSEVNQARTSLRAERNHPMTSVSRAEHRVRCAAFAEALADAAAEAGVPLPYRYRDEMRLYRSMA